MLWDSEMGRTLMYRMDRYRQSERGPMFTEVRANPRVVSTRCRQQVTYKSIPKERAGLLLALHKTPQRVHASAMMGV